MPTALRAKQQLKRLSTHIPAPVLDVVRRVVQPSRYVLTTSTPTFNADGLITVHNTDFLDDPRFSAAYRAGEATGSWNGLHVEYRAYIACWAADRAKHIEGDFVECGVNRGGLARTVCEYVDFKNSERSFYLLDTFNGVPEELLSDDERTLGFTQSMDGYYEECYDDVVKTFSAFANVKIVRGTVPQTLSEVTAEKVAYLSIDMNCVEPEIAAAEHFWDRMSPGATILLDDYAWNKHILQKHAFDAFAAERDIQVLSLPTGQGLIIKP